MLRDTRPADGYVGRPSTSGMMMPVVVSFTVRMAEKAPASVVPVVFSVPTDVPSTVRCVLVDARPVTVRVLLCATSDVALSRRVFVPLTSDVSTTLLVVLSIFDCAVPAAVVIWAVAVRVRPPRVTGPQVTMPVVLENTQLVPTLSTWKGPRPRPGPKP